MRRGTQVLETINAAATVIASADDYVPRTSKRRGSCWGDYWCFGTRKTKRIGHAVLVPEPSSTEPNVLEPEHWQPPSIVVPFVVPPSSPASFIPSEPQSATQSPTGMLSLSVYANMYSPGGPNSIFATGPYAYETQLVSPPVFSTFTTEPSTAPYTPPPESVHMTTTTTPSSPEVPFAHLLEPNLQNVENGYEFQTYQLQPGSPVSHLISPSSGISGSGTSSPFLDREFAASIHPFFLEFRTGNAPKLLDLEKIVRCKFGGSFQGSGAVTPDPVGPIVSCMLDHQDSDVGPLPDRAGSGLLGNDETEVDHRVSFEITNEVIRCVEKKPMCVSIPVLESVENVKHVIEEPPIDVAECDTPETVDNGDETEQQYVKSRTATLGSAKEFNFDNVDVVVVDESRRGSSDWWANEKIDVEKENDCNDWSFFPVMQTGVC